MCILVFYLGYIDTLLPFPILCVHSLSKIPITSLTPLQEKYDLKGSTRNRWCTPKVGAVLKDLNFGTNQIYLDSELRAAFLRQITKDVNLLQTYNVMDYSLLLGVHKPPHKDGAAAQRRLMLIKTGHQGMFQGDV